MSKPNRLGIVIVGLNGAVASTVIAGVKMMVKGLVRTPRDGHREERERGHERRR